MDKMEIKISVILPVYHVEEYIGECIEALKAQTLDGLEFLFVDDCGTDGSAALVQAFADEDARVRLIRCEQNGGPGAARNAGIEAAQGAYLSFVDPDDRIAPDFYALLYAAAAASGCEIVKGKTVGFDGKTGETYPWWEKLNGRIREERKRGVPLYCTHFYDHYSALYSAGLFRDGTVRYGTARNGEDLTFLLKACSRTENLAFEDRAVYYYRKNRDNSATQAFSPKRIRSELDSLGEKADYLCTMELDDYGYAYLASRVHTCLKSYCAFSAPSPERKSLDADYAAEILPIIRRVPGSERIAETSAELYALLEYGVPIPIWSGASEHFHYDRIRRWTDLLTEVPAARETCLDGYIAAILQTASGYFINKRRDPRDKDYLRFIRGQLARLERGFRFRVYARIPVVFVKMALANLAGRRSGRSIPVWKAE